MGVNYEELKELLEDCGVFRKYGHDSWLKYIDEEWEEELSEYVYNAICNRLNPYYQITNKSGKNYTATEHDDRLLKHYSGLCDELIMRGLLDEVADVKDILDPLLDGNNVPHPVIANRFQISQFKKEIYAELIETFLLSTRTARAIVNGIAEIDHDKWTIGTIEDGTFTFSPQ